MSWHMYGSQWTNFRSFFFPSTMWISRMVLRVSGLMADTLPTEPPHQPSWPFLLSLAKVKLTKEPQSQLTLRADIFLLKVFCWLHPLISGSHRWGRGWRNKEEGAELAGKLIFALMFKQIMIFTWERSEVAGLDVSTMMLTRKGSEAAGLNDQ